MALVTALYQPVRYGRRVTEDDAHAAEAAAERVERAVLSPDSHIRKEPE